MADRFDVVAVWIEDVGPVVGRVVLGAKPGTTVVAPVHRDSPLVEGIHGGERDVDGVARHTLSDPEVRVAQLPEPHPGDVVVHDRLVAERGQSFLVEAFAPIGVRHGKTDMIQHCSSPTACET
jgi:hypothetical protein